MIRIVALTLFSWFVAGLLGLLVEAVIDYCRDHDITITVGDLKWALLGPLYFVVMFYAMTEGFWSRVSNITIISIHR